MLAEAGEYLRGHHAAWNSDRLVAEAGVDGTRRDERGRFWLAASSSVPLVGCCWVGRLENLTEKGEAGD